MQDVVAGRLGPSNLPEEEEKGRQQKVPLQEHVPQQPQLLAHDM